MEFVTSIPLLLGVMVFTAEYGEALRERMALDSATHDVGRFLARSPIDNIAALPQPGQPEPPVVPAFYNETIAEAEAMLARRLPNGGFLQTRIYPVDQVNFRTDYFVIEVLARTAADLPLLSLINRFSESDTDNNNLVERESFVDGPAPLWLVMQSEIEVRWLGGAAPGSADCLLQQRYQGLCP